jgi:hypothetical protein
MKLIDEILKELEESIKRHNAERESEGLPSLPRIEIKLLGQFSLMVDPKASRNLTLASTMDVDALIHGEYVLEQDLKNILKRKGLELDELSGEIWIPPGGKFIPLYQSRYISCSYLDPISSLVSKAIKAKEKNRLLIRDAIVSFGKPLLKSIEKHGGDVSYFQEDHED